MSDKDDNSSANEEISAKPWWSEAVKELSSAGLATFFMTEETIRSYLKERKLPKELVGLLMDNVSKRKDDVYGIFAKEVGKMISKIDLSKEVSRFLENHHIHFEAKVSFEPKAGVFSESAKDKEKDNEKEKA